MVQRAVSIIAQCQRSSWSGSSAQQSCSLSSEANQSEIIGPMLSRERVKNQLSRPHVAQVKRVSGIGRSTLRLISDLTVSASSLQIENHPSFDSILSISGFVFHSSPVIVIVKITLRFESNYYPLSPHLRLEVPLCAILLLHIYKLLQDTQEGRHLIKDIDLCPLAPLR